ncbi:hypothetical protein COOONC_04235 [Cooperia oncophora]
MNVHNHPAAGPDVTGLLARNLDAGKTFNDNAGRPEALIDPDGREFIAPLKKRVEVRKTFVFQFGMMTTFAILVHEIPHEVSDFAILLRADFNRMQAVKAQLVTASGGIIGAVVALWINNDSMQSADWILAFTAGGFINIALAQILPELNEERDRRQNLKQVAMMFLGLFVMIAISSLKII